MNLVCKGDGAICAVRQEDWKSIINNDVTLSIVYYTYDNINDLIKSSSDTTETANDDYVAVYLDGGLVAYCPHPSDNYQNGLVAWNNEECPFFIGVCPWKDVNNLYYLDGEIYATRLYNKSLSDTQIKGNFEKNKTYREEMKKLYAK